MPRPARDYTGCPDWGPRPVLLPFGKHGEAYYRCPYRRARGACGDAPSRASATDHHG